MSRLCPGLATTACCRPSLPIVRNRRVWCAAAAQRVSADHAPSNAVCKERHCEATCPAQSARAGLVQRTLAGMTVIPIIFAAGSLMPGATSVAAEVPAEGLQYVMGTYEPSPYTPGWEVWFGAAVATIPFIIGAWEFGKRIIIQRRCQACEGRGLVLRGKFPKKCPECGGFFPWVSWRMFLLSTATPGNGGPLLQPKGQTSIFYKVPAPSTQEAGATPTSVPVTPLSAPEEKQQEAGMTQPPNK